MRARRLDIERFGASHPLRPYQLEVARAIIDSVRKRDGRIFSVMFARQMGKNETSARLEAFLLASYSGRGGTIVKAAPTFKPQTITSMLRLRETLAAAPETAGLWERQYGYMMRAGKASIAFFSADKHANVVGATASLLLEIDEAQDVDRDKYDRDFRPMASSTNATTVLYGTAWSEDSILERQKRLNQEREARTGERLHFEYDWTHLAALNPQYRAFVEAEIARLGIDHPTIKTQYLLQALPDAGRLFNEENRAALAGGHVRQRSPAPEALYVAGIDLAGESEEALDAALRSAVPRKDSTVVTIAEVTRDGQGQPVARVVEHLWWTGRGHLWQYERLVALWERWSLARVAVDASGVGAGIASFLATRFGERAQRVIFTAPSKSVMAYNMLEMVGSGRLSIYARDGSAEWEECWKEIRACRYNLRQEGQMGWSVPDTEGHDDFVASLGLCAQAATTLSVPAASGLVRARPLGDEGW